MIAVPTDVRDPGQVDALAAAALDRFGRVDVVCNNAGAVCPGVVDTNIHHADRNRPGGSADWTPELGGPVLDTLLEWAASISGPSMSAADAADIVVRSIEVNRLHVAPNGSTMRARARIDRLLADLDEERRETTEPQAADRTFPGSSP